jgi:hypothetical protein
MNNSIMKGIRLLPVAVLLICSFLSILGLRRQMTWTYYAGLTATLGAKDCSNTLEPLPPQQQLDSILETVPVFYNLFVANATDSPRVKKLVLDQLSNLLPQHQPVHAHSIGYSMDIPNTNLLEHHQEGTEIDSLYSLWEYCVFNPHSKVIYLHSKGSFHPKQANDDLRQFLTAGALSKECLQLPNTCNVCSSRMSPIPHPHTPGNMWLARCDYIQRLMNPRLFEAKMVTVTTIPKKNSTSLACHGLGRYSAEHWVHSHPSCNPCDLSNDSKFTWAYQNVPRANFEKQLAMAPRFHRNVYKHSRYCRVYDSKKKYKTPIGFSVQARLQEYKQLYNASPDESWWGWEFY